MKNKLFPILFFCCAIFTFATAQSPHSHTKIPIDARLLKIYSGEHLENLREANPYLLKRWNFYLDHSWYLTDLPAEKELDSYPTIRIDDSNSINIFELEKQFSLRRKWEKQSVLKIENTSQALVLVSGKRFNELLNAHLAAEKIP